MERIDEFLKERAESGLLRVLRPISRRENGKILINQKEYLDFSSNDYLGLSDHPKLIEVGKKALEEFGASSSASRLLSGDLELHHKLEEKIAEFKNKEAALFFNSGYQANTGLLSALYKKGDCVFCDRLSHASIIDGAVLSQAKIFRFRHNDAGHLEELLKKERKQCKRALIATESIFSMDGDRACLKELVSLKNKYDCQIFVDEAHATGIFGAGGSGIVEEEGLAGEIDFIMGTFSKALGSFGAYLAASEKTIRYLINACRSFIYSTALPASIAACNLASIELIKSEAFRRRKLLDLSGYFRERLKNKGFKVKGTSQIVPLVLGENEKALTIASALQEKGWWVLPIRYPTVPRNEARLRFSLTFYHEQEVLDQLIDELSRIGI